MSSAVLRASGTKNKRMIKSTSKKKNSENIFGMKISEGTQERKPVNVKSTFYDFNDYPNIMVNRQCDSRSLSEFKKSKYDEDFESIPQYTSKGDIEGFTEYLYELQTEKGSLLTLEEIEQAKNYFLQNKNNNIKVRAKRIDE